MKGKVKVKSLSHVQLLAIPWAAAYQAPTSMGFSRQEHWREGCHCLLLCWPLGHQNFLFSTGEGRKENEKIHGVVSNAQLGGQSFHSFHCLECSHTEVQSSCLPRRQGGMDSDKHLCHKGLYTCVGIFWKSGRSARTWSLYWSHHFLQKCVKSPLYLSLSRQG